MRLAIGLLLFLLCSCASLPKENSKQVLTTEQLATLTAAGEDGEGQSKPSEPAPNLVLYPLQKMGDPVQPSQSQPISPPPPTITIFQQSNIIFQSR